MIILNQFLFEFCDIDELKIGKRLDVTDATANK